MSHDILNHTKHGFIPRFKRSLTVWLCLIIPPWIRILIVDNHHMVICCSLKPKQFQALIIRPGAALGIDVSIVHSLPQKKRGRIARPHWASMTIWFGWGCHNMGRYQHYHRNQLFAHYPLSHQLFLLCCRGWVKRYHNTMILPCSVRPLFYAQKTSTYH